MTAIRADVVGPLLSLEPPVTPDREEARRWAIEELSKPQYPDATPGWLEQLWRDFLDWLSSLEGDGTSADTNFALPLIVILAVALIVVAVVVVRPRLNARRASRQEDIYGADSTMNADDYRTRASAAADDGDWAAAVVDHFRAVVRSAEERDIIAVRAGRTADEAAAQLGQVFGAAQQRLVDAARLFDAVRYGEQNATRTDYGSLRDLDAELLGMKPDFAGSVDSGFAVPR
ncbi:MULTISPECIES: DUF4129 domain-containing protein [Paenarthrobacter]|jgi:hypothetical protein|uniref:DUF4129 domain-containing protein n=1 Tax=Paenarthrobacter TaxID=1742992 RepID=UPI0023664564|nr:MULTISPECIES: DUF4129 domain-containing protein [Paenarthrobacter]MDD7835270.1 DUF4129 domain-containing protein [Paenarthrobacter sp. AB444]MDP9935290.1 hypothetical protein [Paenarthrobacter nicotinovorans]